MAPTPRGSPAGIVFRRLDADADRRQAVRLLPGCELGDHDPTCVWYGLCDLTVAETGGLAAVAVVRTVGPVTARLCGLAVSTAYRGRRLGRRLVCEVADRLRASGVEELTAPTTLDHRVAALLAHAGFAARDQQPQDRGPGWLSLPL
jgi:GNAT superfamily N-acetyltransferase